MYNHPVSPTVSTRLYYRLPYQYHTSNRLHLYSYIYSDKSDGALLKLEKFGEVSIIPVTDIPGISVYPAISNGEIAVCTPGKAVIKVMNVGGYILADYQSEGKLTIGMNYTDGVYLVGVETENIPRMATYKVMLCR